MNNMDRLNEIGVMLAAHITKGYFAHVDTWLIEVCDDYQYHVDGVLVTVKKSAFANLFPHGSYVCGCCKESKKMDRNSVSYWDDDEEYIVCRDCKIHDNKVMLPVVARFYDILPHLYHTLNGDLVTVRDRRRTDAECAERIDKLGVQFAQSVGGVYFKNLDTNGLRAYFVQKKVVRKFKAWREKKRRGYIAQVLYECAAVGKDAALVLAGQVVI